DPGDEHEPELGRRAAQLEHRERQRDREDAVAEHGDGLPPEEQREVALAQHRQAAGPLHGERAYCASRFSPVISRGADRPRRARTVGARSPSLPPERNCAPATVTTRGTGVVVCAVWGDTSRSSICSAFPWSAVTSPVPPACSTAARIAPSAASDASTPAITAGRTPVCPTMSGWARLTTAKAYPFPRCSAKQRATPAAAISGA